MSVAHVGEGRFAFRYTGDADVANYVGIDTVSVLSVPEPSAYLMLGVGLFGLTMLRRRQA
ncbi:choice-of-anchor J domain-containing protein [Massilia sp. R798]|uniref:Choice-of-anchor J domain-containing protein n=1 Tax=Massilia soli TaxID=2792854 RepID=A0ABS7SLT3_9BURK|nr:choice-of-anchor J domain-containing protein [Massilia soli]